MMKIYSWNVNSIRARLEHTLLWLEKNQPDVLCLQEIKVQEDQFPLAEFTDKGWHVALAGQRTYNGVALISKQPLEDVRIGLGDAELDTQQRLIAGTCGDVRVLNLYAPNGKEVDSEPFAFKEKWYAKLAEYLQTHFKPTDKVLLCGDFNIAPADIDTWDPAEWVGKILFSEQEHAWLQTLLDWGLTDSFRHLHPTEQQFSWWDYRQASLRRNRGMRIDHVLLTQPLLAQCQEALIDKAPRTWDRPSDHTPVGVVLG